MNQILHGFCEEILPTLEENSFHSIVTDPPYGLSFMGKEWDHGVPGAHIWLEALRVARPGAYLLAFGGTRTSHRLAVAIEDAGWEIRDTIMWVYGSGFPKSLDIGKAVDKLQGVERKIIGYKEPFGREGRNTKPTGNYNAGLGGNYTENTKDLRPIYDSTSEWEGWGTALKPAWEPIIIARKPISEKNIAENVLKWGVGGINIDGCRVETADDLSVERDGHNLDTRKQGWGFKAVSRGNQGRFPANLIHDGSDEVLSLFPNSKSSDAVRKNKQRTTMMLYGDYNSCESHGFNDSGSAARFFYCAKASKQDRDEGCENIQPHAMCDLDKMGGSKCTMKTGSGNDRNVTYKNNHPTVKPTSLMRYLCRLVTPKNGIILDPFCGSGSTGKAAIKEGFCFTGIDKDIESVNLARARINIDPLFREAL